MILSGICTSYSLERFLGLHREDDEYRLALYTDNADIGEETERYTPEGEVPESQGYSAGGFLLTGFQAGKSGHITHVTFDDIRIDPATIEADGCLIYNRTRENRAVGVFRFPDGRVKSTNGPFDLFMPAPGPQALLRNA